MTILINQENIITNHLIEEQIIKNLKLVVKMTIDNQTIIIITTIGIDTTIIIKTTIIIRNQDILQGIISLNNKSL